LLNITISIFATSLAVESLEAVDLEDPSLSTLALAFVTITDVEGSVLFAARLWSEL
jgi:hypothetical protein